MGKRKRQNPPSMFCLLNSKESWDGKCRGRPTVIRSHISGDWYISQWKASKLYYTVLENAREHSVPIRWTFQYIWACQIFPCSERSPDKHIYWTDKTGMEAMPTQLNSEGMHIPWVAASRPKSGQKVKSLTWAGGCLGVQNADGSPVEKTVFKQWVRYGSVQLVCCQLWENTFKCEWIVFHRMYWNFIQNIY